MGVYDHPFAAFHGIDSLAAILEALVIKRFATKWAVVHCTGGQVSSEYHGLSGYQ